VSDAIREDPKLVDWTSVESPAIFTGKVTLLAGTMKLNEDILVSKRGPIVPSVVISPVIVTVVEVVEPKEVKLKVNGNETAYDIGVAAGETIWARAAKATPRAKFLAPPFQNDVRPE
jgi:hypothetical protein